MSHDAALMRYAFAASTAMALLVLFHVVQRLVAPRHTLESDAKKKNVAYLLVQAGHVAAVLFLVPWIVREALTHQSIATCAAWAAVFGVAGVVLIQLVGEIGIRLLL